MSKLHGHAKMTKIAVDELKNNFSHDSTLNKVATSFLRGKILAGDVVLRDIADLTGGHWADYGQSH